MVEQFRRELLVAAPRATVWNVVTDVDRLAGWISIVGSALELARLERYSAVLEDRMGPFRLRADLNIEVLDARAPEFVRVRAAGEDRQIGSRIAVAATLAIAEFAPGSLLTVEGSYEVTGRVAALGTSSIRKKAARVLDEFIESAQAELGPV